MLYKVCGVHVMADRAALLAAQGRGLKAKASGCVGLGECHLFTGTQGSAYIMILRACM